MSKPDSIMIDSVKYIREDTAPSKFEPTSLKIVVADRGWVFIGNVTTKDDGLHLSNAKVIRVWGTTKGLGEIAIGGPTKKTVLDDAGSVMIPHAATIMVMDADASKWA